MYELVFLYTKEIIMPQPTDPNLQNIPNRKYKCGCVCPTPAPKETEENICPACLAKENLKK